MNSEEFAIHACEQVLRFTRTESWANLSEALKVQLAFNMGVVSLGLQLSKSEGYEALANVRECQITMQMLREHLESVIDSRGIKVDETRIMRPF